MENDRELLELAAKAAGIELGEWDERMGAYACPDQFAGVPVWNPLELDRDALRLAVKLWLMNSGIGFAKVLCELQQMIYPANFDPDRPYAATRRAIVRAAAEIGRRMKCQER